MLSSLRRPANIAASMRRTFANQPKLENLPVPKLEDTALRYVRSLEPVLQPDQLASTKKAVADFLENEGPVLQRKLEEHAKGKANWLEEWWDDGYFQARDPLPVGTNPSFVLSDPEAFGSIPADRIQAWRAAQILYSSMQFMLKLYSEELVPDPDACMSQFARVFSTARVPRAGQDQVYNYIGHPPSLPTKHYLLQYKPSCPTHVIVTCRGQQFVVEALASDGKSVLPFEQMEGSMQAVLEAAAAAPVATNPGVFTAVDRDTWAAAREGMIRLSPTNEASLELVQQALFMFALDDAAPTTYTEQSARGVMGDGHQRWYDKHVAIVFQNGKACLNFEHGVVDGLPLVRLLQEVNNCPSAAAAPASPSMPQAPPRRVEWVTDKHIDQASAAASASYELHRQSVDFTTLKWDKFGRSDIKKMGASPDAFVQMAIQLAYYRLLGMCVPTYESASTRAFIHGRTETLRSCTLASQRFVMSMDTPLIQSDRKRQLCLSLMRAAFKAHSANIKVATKGQGVDRHLLGLKLIAMQEGMPTPKLFEDPAYAYSGTWQLSTSSMPTEEIVAWGAVMPTGYGIYYCMPTKYTGLNFMISSYHGNDRPTSQFKTALVQAMEDMAALLRSDVQAKL